MKASNEQQILTISLLRIVGYGLLMMATVDFLNLFIPPELMNPNWEFQTIGAMIERIPIIFLGIVFVFYEDTNYRTPIEKKLLKIISWFCLVFAIFLILAIPLNINNAFRIYHSYNAKVNYQLIPRLETIEDFQTQIESANSHETIAKIIQKKTLKKVGIPKSLELDEIKGNFAQSLQKESDSLQSKAQNSRSSKRDDLFRKVIKYNLGALIAICLLIFVWKNTFWARVDYSWE